MPAALIPLLREPHGRGDALAPAPVPGGVAGKALDASNPADGTTVIPALAGGHRDELGLARGIAVGLLLMVPFWAAVLYVLVLR